MPVLQDVLHVLIQLSAPHAFLDSILELTLFATLPASWVLFKTIALQFATLVHLDVLIVQVQLFVLNVSQLFT